MFFFNTGIQPGHQSGHCRCGVLVDICYQGASRFQQHIRWHVAVVAASLPVLLVAGT